MKSFLTALALVGFVLAATPVALAKPAADKVAAAKAPPKVFAAPQKKGTKATCPVLGEEFVIAQDTAHAEYKGKYVYFCCPSCKAKFEQEPEKYLK
jgi:YHS domain-containing protein